MEKVRIHLFVSGRVQGVFFRQSTQLKAQALNVKGWVRNLPDGRVEAILEGYKPAVEALVDYCRHGPSTASVDDVEIINENYVGEFSYFEVL